MGQSSTVLPTLAGANASVAVPPALQLSDVFWDPTFFVLMLIFVGLAVVSYLHPSGRRFIKRQTDYLDHQQATNEKALAQTASMEAMIAKQYAETNERTDKALEQASLSLQLHSEALEQLKGMNAAIGRLTALLEQERSGRPA